MSTVAHWPFPPPDEPYHPPGVLPLPTGPQPRRPPPTVVTQWSAESGDVTDALMRRRILLHSGELDQAAAQDLSARAMLVDADGPEPVHLHLACPYAELAAAVMLTETLQLLRSRLVATAIGAINGAAVAIYAAARTRRARALVTFVLTEPRTAARGTGDQLAAQAAGQTQQLTYLTEVIAAASNRPAADVAEDMRSGTLLAAEQALAYGLVDEVLRPARP